MIGDLRIIRIGAGAAGDEDYTCLACAAAKSRPAIKPANPPRWPKAVLEAFPLAPVQAALDDIEFHDVPPEAAIENLQRTAKLLHPGHAMFTHAAVSSHLTDATSSGAETLHPVSHYWVAQKENRHLWEHYAWGRRYESADQSIREHRFLCLNKAGARDRPLANIAIAAYTTAFGSPAPWPKPEFWHEPFELAGSVDVRLVRVVEIGLMDGSRLVHFEGTPAEAEAYYAEHGRARVAQIAAGGPARPGSSCAGCKLITACPTLLKAPGLLGVPAARRPLRKVSVSDLRYHCRCPAQAHLYSLNLPRQAEYSADAVIGQAVHAHLETNHRNPLRVPCNAFDMAVDQARWTAGRWTLMGEHAAIGARMLAHHVDVCPLDNPVGVSELRVEPTIAFYDTAANTVVLAKPDLLYREGDSWIWHEIKTTQKHRWYHDSLLDEFPQLALAVLILNRGLLGGDPAGSRVELETLRPYIADPDMIDPTDAATVAKAQQVIRDLAQPWRDDQLFAAQPGKACRTCPVSRWCPSFDPDHSEPGEGGVHD